MRRTPGHSLAQNAGDRRVFWLGRSCCTARAWSSFLPLLQEVSSIYKTRNQLCLCRRCIKLSQTFNSGIWGLSKHSCATSNNDVVVCEFLGKCAARQIPAGGSGWKATNTLLTVLPSQPCPSRHRGISSSVLCLPSHFFRSKR